MIEKSADLEQRVHRIHALLEEQDAKVTWNERIPDPDNLDQARQIDVTIRRGGRLTLVECRLHRAPQDVTWIEELIGRRTSLRASTVIAVSASGFTEGARKKAIAHGIILRDFQTLSANEVADWGKRKQIELEFLEFKHATLRVALPIVPMGARTLTTTDGKPLDARTFISAAKARIDKEQLPLGSRQPKGAIIEIASPILVNGVRANSSYLLANVRRVRRKISTTSVVSYLDTASDGIDPMAHVSELDLGKSEVVEHSNRALVALDLSQIKPPRDCVFSSVLFDFGQPVIMNAMQLYGLEALTLISHLNLRLEFYPTNAMPQPRWPRA